MKTQVIKTGMLTGLFVLFLSLITVAQENAQNYYRGGTYSFFYDAASQSPTVSKHNIYRRIGKGSDRLSKTSAEESTKKRWGVEFNLGGSYATSSLAGSNLNMGMGFEGIFSYRFLPHTGVYAGWGWNKFSADNSFAGSHMDFEETGYVYGVQFKHPIENSTLSYYLRAGGLYNHIELEDKSGDIIGDTGHGTGWQIAGGIELALSDKWNLTPGIKYNSLSRNIELHGSNYSLKHNYLSLRVGFLRNF